MMMVKLCQPGQLHMKTNANTPEFHGIHVAGTAAGQHYGWGPEKQISII